ncbi:hypothetical protein EJ08DRAFT_646856 [Tothia fuscella]|uniref:Tetraspanin n=1 Tax=Tothia fuscella TaxID=1048955 RepID=A0A9P4NYH5_9PEZI|nr:hypothetical protein EJ08DRAFT_646856 [Tothia fuscella]
MAWTRLQVFTAFSALFLTALTAIAAYTMHTTRNHNLPIPSTLSAFTLALPLITGLAMQSLTLSIQKLRSQKSNRPHTPPYTTPTLLILFIYDAVLATLAGTYITPISNLHCGLEDKWQGLWHAKNGKAIRRIQDAFECCGLHSTSDRAYPFPGKDVGVDGCRRMFGYEGSCFGKWRGEERKVAGMMLVVVGCVGLWKVRNWISRFFRYALFANELCFLDSYSCLTSGQYILVFNG